MASPHIISAPFSLAASEAGALPGHGVRCTCGYIGKTSLSTREATNLGIAHVVWATKAGK